MLWLFVWSFIRFVQRMDQFQDSYHLNAFLIQNLETPSNVEFCPNRSESISEAGTDSIISGFCTLRFIRIQQPSILILFSMNIAADPKENSEGHRQWAMENDSPFHGQPSISLFLMVDPWLRREIQGWVRPGHWGVNHLGAVVVQVSNHWLWDEFNKEMNSGWKR